MMRLSARVAPTLTTLLLALMTATASWAGTGFAVSGPAAIDTQLPVVVIDNLPPSTVRQAGETISLTWTAADDNPDSTAGANVAQMWFGDVLYESHPFSPGTGPHLWQWTVPDTTSGTAHLVVHSMDTFGNSTTAGGDDFTILSATTDVPSLADQQLFAPPVPNPFNPQTELFFDLPAAGSVRVTVHDARGYLIDTLLADDRPAGPMTLAWDGTDRTGRRQAGGTYFFRLVYRAGGHNTQQVRKAVLLP